jgi:hypothetical protein
MRLFLAFVVACSLASETYASPIVYDIELGGEINSHDLRVSGSISADLDSASVIASNLMFTRTSHGAEQFSETMPSVNTERPNVYEIFSSSDPEFQRGFEDFSGRLVVNTDDVSWRFGIGQENRLESYALSLRNDGFHEVSWIFSQCCFIGADETFVLETPDRGPLRDLAAGLTVPEPGAFMMCATGLMLIGWSRRMVHRPQPCS